VCLDRERADHEPRRDVLVPESLCEEPQNLSFPARQLIELASKGLGGLSLLGRPGDDGMPGSWDRTALPREPQPWLR
jgi:hypothetical protein